MERYVGVNPNVPRLPRPALPPEVPLGPVGSGTPSPSRTTLAQRCATLKEAGPQSPYTFHPDGGRDATEEQVLADESRWGCHGRETSEARLLGVFGAPGSVRRGPTEYADPALATHGQWHEGLEPDHSKKSARPGVRARPVEKGSGKARARAREYAASLQPHSKAAGARTRGTGKGRGRAGGKETYTRAEYRYATRKAAAERLVLVRRLKEMEAELLHCRRGQGQPQPAAPDDGSVVVSRSPLLCDERVRSDDGVHSRASLACEVERELLLLALEAESALARAGVSGRTQAAAVRGYAELVSQISTSFHDALEAVRAEQLGDEAEGREGEESEVLRRYACVVLDHGEQLRNLRKRHASLRERLTAAAVADHARAEAEAHADGGEVSMSRELHELSVASSSAAPPVTPPHSGADDSAEYTYGLENSGREEAVLDGLAELSVSTVGAENGDESGSPKTQAFLQGITDAAGVVGVLDQLESADGQDEEEATEEALVRLTEKVAALTAINERLEEQLLEQEQEHDTSEPERLAG